MRIDLSHGRASTARVAAHLERLARERRAGAVCGPVAVRWSKAGVLTITEERADATAAADPQDAIREALDAACAIEDPDPRGPGGP